MSIEAALAKIINDAIDRVADRVIERLSSMPQPSASTPTADTPTSSPSRRAGKRAAAAPDPKPVEKQPEVTLERTQKAVLDACDRVGRDAVVKVLGGFEVKKASELAADRWPELIAQLEALEA